MFLKSQPILGEAEDFSSSSAKAYSCQRSEINNLRENSPGLRGMFLAHASAGMTTANYGAGGGLTELNQEEEVFSHDNG
jgi:hypothetical protein